MGESIVGGSTLEESRKAAQTSNNYGKSKLLRASYVLDIVLRTLHAIF